MDKKQAIIAAAALALSMVGLLGLTETSRKFKLFK